MAFTGIEIYKLLPKTNCGECGVPTCLAFAMALAAGKTELDRCPHVSAESKAKLADASSPPVRLVTIGAGNAAVRIGGETVLFRHEKRFENPPGIAVLIKDTFPELEINRRLELLSSLQYERVGKTLKADMVALEAESGNASRFSALASEVAEKTDVAPILMSSDPDVMAAGLKELATRHPLIYAATEQNFKAMSGLAKENACPLAVKAADIELLNALSSKVTEEGVKDIVLDCGASSLQQAFRDQTLLRRAALSRKYRALGFPTICLPYLFSENVMTEALSAAIFIAKYAGIIVLSDFHGESLFPLLVERLNIYTDPQRPLATQEGIYEIGKPDENSPVLITSNFSLTYFIVSGEIENSRVPSFLLVKNTEGLSVMTAWAAGKFNADNISPFVKSSGIDHRARHRQLIIPGYIAAESGAIQDETGWEVIVGPREAANIPAFLRSRAR